MSTLMYLESLKGKLEYQNEYKRLESILCEEDKRELENNVPIQSVRMYGFHQLTSNKILVVYTRSLQYKLVKWDGTHLIEENGKMYTWSHNPYELWSGVA